MKVAIRLLAMILLLAAGAVRAADAPEFAIDQVLGNAAAPVTIIEYASLTCPHCAHFHETTLPKLRAEWIDTGKVKMIYRDFPTAPSDLSIGAGMIAHCAGKDRYFGVLGLLFKAQGKWATSNEPLTDIKQAVRLAGMTGEQVDACLQKQDLWDAIVARANAATKTYGIDGTPTLIIDGKMVSGGESYETISRLIQEAARKAKK